MSRELKFRSWNLETKFMYDNIENGVVAKNQKGEIVLGLSFGSICRDQNSIIMQFTGLTDKNGKEIYEGDIIKCKPIDVIHPQDLFKYNNFEFLISAVYWSKEYCCFEIDFNSSCFADSETVFEVIGNIHQNPELLKQ